MKKPLLEVYGLKTWFKGKDKPFKVVDGVDFTIPKGQTFALLGESGCGKSMTALSILRLNPQPASQIVQGEIYLDGKNLLDYSEAEMEKVRGRRIAMIFQEPQSSLNPVLTVGQQIGEVLAWHLDLTESEIESRILALLDLVGLPDPEARMHSYPHQLSGGMKQRIMIAIALAIEPELLIADEPTTALDVTIQAQILALLKDIQKRTGMSILFITHDLGVAFQIADEVGVMYAGQIVEKGKREHFFNDAKHPYSKKLFEAVPAEHKREEMLTVIKGTVPQSSKEFKGCRFVERCELADAYCTSVVPQWLEQNDHGVRCHLYDDQIKDELIKSEHKHVAKSHLSEVLPTNTPSLQVNQLKVHFPIRKGVFQRVKGYVKAVDGIDLTLNNAETLALVGESGCGKSTIGKGILQLVPLTSGEVIYQGAEINKLNSREMSEYRASLQIIFQDPFSAMNPRMTVAQVIEEGLMLAGIKQAAEKDKRIDALLSRVGMSPENKHRYPHEFSGGQRQRICIARALATEPEVIVCDEPTSALDVSVQAQILNLLRDIQHEFGLSFLFITHNIAVVDYLAHRVAVMYLGKIVEQGTRKEILHSPKHPYTQALLDSVPRVGTELDTEQGLLTGELPSPANPPQGCHFHLRCPHVMDICKTKYPEVSLLSDTHSIKCFLYENENKESSA